MGVLTLPLTVLADSPLEIFLRVLCNLPLYIDYSQVRLIHQYICAKANPAPGMFNDPVGVNFADWSSPDLTDISPARISP